MFGLGNFGNQAVQVGDFLVFITGKRINKRFVFGVEKIVAENRDQFCWCVSCIHERSFVSQLSAGVRKQLHVGKNRFAYVQLITSPDNGGGNRAAAKKLLY